MEKILKFFGLYKPKPCKHENNTRVRKYKLRDGTPMIEVDCYDCGYSDHGHVYANDWPESLVITKDGKVI